MSRIARMKQANALADDGLTPQEISDALGFNLSTTKEYLSSLNRAKYSDSGKVCTRCKKPPGPRGLSKFIYKTKPTELLCETCLVPDTPAYIPIYRQTRSIFEA
jgi:hypothetical protein